MLRSAAPPRRSAVLASFSAWLPNPIVYQVLLAVVSVPASTNRNGVAAVACAEPPWPGARPLSPPAYAVFITEIWLLSVVADTAPWPLVLVITWKYTFTGTEPGARSGSEPLDPSAAWYWFSASWTALSSTLIGCGVPHRPGLAFSSALTASAAASSLVTYVASGPQAANATRTGTRIRERASMMSPGEGVTKNGAAD